MTRFIAILIWISYIVGSNCCEASCFRLFGGARESEGLLQINVSNAWKNVCFIDGLKQHELNLYVCKQINSSSRFQSGVSINGPLIYRNKTGKGGIKMNNLTCQATMDETDACKQFTICCQKIGETVDKQRSLCSSNWLETKYCYSGNVAGIRGFLKYHAIQNVRRSWTSSAFKDACTNKTSNFEITSKKLNKCLRTIHANSNNTYALIEGDNCKWTNGITCNEKTQTFQLLEGKTARMDDLHCVTVEVQNGTRNIAIANCSLYLPAVCLDVKQEEKENYTEFSNQETTTMSTNTLRNLTTSSWNEEENVRPQYVIIATVPLTFLVVILILIAGFQIRKSRKRLTERQRPNSVHNDTYNRERDAVERTEERYNRIRDFNLTDFKPELPVRGPTNQISVLDDYSMPLDSIPQEKETGEYFVTYDDPIRSLVKQHNEDNNHLSETRVESLKRKFPDDEHACFSTHTDESCLILNKGQVEFNRFKKAEAFSSNRTVRLKENISDKTKDANNVKCEISEKKIVSEPCISTRLDNNLSTDQTKINSLNGIALQNRVSVESSNGYTDCISKRPIKLIKQSEDSDDYEDTSNVNPEQFCAGAKPKERLFVNHVCIDCLTPDHLKKLGIRIIPDKSAYTLYNFFKIPKRFSDSALELYVNTADLKRSECSEITSKSRYLMNEEDKRNENDRKSYSENEHDKQRSKEERDYFKYPRKHSLCHANSYDILGAFSKRNDDSHSENVYHKLADVRIWTQKHVKCRHGRHKST